MSNRYREYNHALDATTIATACRVEHWAFLIEKAQEYEAAELEAMLPGLGFKAAIETIEVIPAKIEDKKMYDQREKAQRDCEWAIFGARQAGLAEGREEGREHGKLAGQIQLLKQLLGRAPASDDDLKDVKLDALEKRFVELQQQLRDRRSALRV